LNLPILLPYQSTAYLFSS